MSIRAASLLIPLPVFILFLPPIFIISVPFLWYIDRYQVLLFPLAGWLLLDGISQLLFLRGSRSGWYTVIMLVSSLALVITLTNLDYLEGAQKRWFSLSILAVLPLVFTNTRRKALWSHVTASLICYTALGLCQFLHVLDPLNPLAITLALAYSFLGGSLLAQLPFLRAINLDEFDRGNTPLLRFHSVLWGIPLAVIVASVCTGYLSNLFLLLLISLLLISRISKVRGELASGGDFPAWYSWLGLVTLYFQVLLLFGAAVLSYQIAHDNVSEAGGTPQESVE